MPGSGPALQSNRTLRTMTTSEHKFEVAFSISPHTPSPSRARRAELGFCVDRPRRPSFGIVSIVGRCATRASWPEETGTGCVSGQTRTPCASDCRANFGPHLFVFPFFTCQQIECRRLLASNPLLRQVLRKNTLWAVENSKGQIAEVTTKSSCVLFFPWREDVGVEV